MTIQPSPYEILQAIQDQQRATDRLIGVLARMLDRSSPDPFLTGGPSEPAADLPALPRRREPVQRSEPEKRASRVAGERGRPRAGIEVDGKLVDTTERRARMIRSVMTTPATAKHLVDLGFAKTVEAVRATVIDINTDLAKAGVFRRMQPIERLPVSGKRGGSHAARYGLIDPNALPELSTAAQSEGAAGASPEEAAPVSAIRDGGLDVAQGAEFVTPPVPEEEAATSADPAPVADDEITEVVSAIPPRADDKPPAAPLSPPSPPAATLEIAAFDLLAVDLATHECLGPRGRYRTGGQKMAKTLDMLKGGQMFGHDFVAKRCGWQSADVARAAIHTEKAKLAAIGVDAYVDKFNVILRAPE